MSFERLFTPITVGPMEVPNRICETTNTIGAGRLDGLPDDAFIAHHVDKARGGTGWIGHATWVLNDPLPPAAPQEFVAGGASVRAAGYQRPDFVERVRRFTDAVHEAGAVAVAQLTHLNPTFGPSPVAPAEFTDLVPHEMDDSEIRFVIRTYAEAAAAFRQAGMDGIEIHCAHECLPQMFLSPALNRRTDAWGGDTPARTRFVAAVLEAVREAVGDGMALGIRVDAWERRRGGYRLEEGQEIVAHLAGTGLLDFLDVDVGHSWGPVPYVPPSYQPVAVHAEAARAMKDAAGSVAVLHAGRVNDPAVAEDLLAAGVCDVVGMTRAGIADPEFPTKAREGRTHEIRPCIACNRCIGESVHGLTPPPFRTAVCSVNSRTGNELLWKAEYRPAARPGRVVVVGGGPAGLEAARVAAMRGHAVTLLERHPQLGGQLYLASRSPGREDFAGFIRYMETQIKLLGIDLRLGSDAGVADVVALSPDAVVCATGAVPIVPDVPGVDGPGVVLAWDVLRGTVATGQRVAVISEEDHMETINVALLLAAGGNDVDIFHKWRGVGAEVDRYTIGVVLGRLEEAGVRVHSGLRAAAVQGSAVEFTSAYTGARRVMDGFDTVVLACGARPDAALYRALDGQVERRWLVGAAWTPRGIREATEHGMKAGLHV